MRHKDHRWPDVDQTGDDSPNPIKGCEAKSEKGYYCTKASKGHGGLHQARSSMNNRVIEEWE